MQEGVEGLFGLAGSAGLAVAEDAEVVVVFDEGLHVREVEVHHVVLGEQGPETADAGEHHAVGESEGFGKGRVRRQEAGEVLVGQDDDGVADALEGFEAFLGLGGAVVALEIEGQGREREDEQPLFAGDAGEDGRDAGAGAAAEPDDQQQQLVPGDQGAQGIGVFLGRHAADVGVAAGAEALGDLLADDERAGNAALGERAGVGVDGGGFGRMGPVGRQGASEGGAGAAADGGDEDLRADAGGHRGGGSVFGGLDVLGLSVHGGHHPMQRASLRQKPPARAACSRSVLSA